MKFIIFVSYFYTVLISVVGYGFLLQKILFKEFIKKKEFFIYLGFYGLVFLTFLSYLTSLVTAHNIIHNSLIHLIGFFFGVYFCFITRQNKYLKYIFYISLILLPGLFISKTHDDFPYYHLPYTIYLTENKLIFGMGHLNHGYNLLSSLFNFNSLMKLPYLELYGFHFIYIYFLIFFNFFIISEFFLNKNHKIMLFLYLSAFVFFNVSFTRIAEFGTDKPGQLLIVLITIKLFYFIFFSKKVLFEKEVLILLPLFAYVITLKAYFASYILFLLLIFSFRERFFSIVKYLFASKSFLFSFFLIFLMCAHYFVATGCLVSPIKNLCYGNLFTWGRSLTDINALSQWLEQWAKAGAGPGFRVVDPSVYIQYLNWLPNWFEKYFLIKVLDQIAILLVSLFLVIYVLFNLKISKERIYNKKFIFFFSILFLIFLIWFFKHPALRYGGYAICFLIICMGLNFVVARLELKKSFNFNAKLLIIFVCLIFSFKNMIRINHELKRNDFYRFDEFPLFKIKKLNFDRNETSSGLIINYPKIMKDSWDYCWNIPSPCTMSKPDISVNRNFGYYFIRNKISD